MLRVDGKQDWKTPQWLFDYLSNYFGPFSLDAAATRENTKCGACWTEENSGLTHPWYDKTFCNPPWSKPLPWVLKARSEYIDQNVRSVLLLPAITMFAKWFWERHDEFETKILTPRIAYEGGNGKSSPNGGTILLIFDGHMQGNISMMNLTKYRPCKS